MILLLAFGYPLLIFVGAVIRTLILIFHVTIGHVFFKARLQRERSRAAAPRPKPIMPTVPRWTPTPTPPPPTRIWRDE